MTSIIPPDLKSAMIIPLLKITVISGLDNNHPVILTPIIMKCILRLVLQYIKANFSLTFNPHQFA